PVFPFQTVEQGSKLLDFATQSQDAHLLIAQSMFELLEQAHDLAQLALHGKRCLGPLLASSHGHIMETFSGMREEKRVRILAWQIASECRIGHDIAIAQLGEDYLKRLAKAIQHADGVLQRKDGGWRIGT